jgi:cytochrome c-type biogenesis protein CcmH
MKTAAAFLLLALAGCAREEARVAPPPAPKSTTPDTGLRPLTSRDHPPASASADASGLPPGHPPISGGASNPAAAASGLSISGRVSLAPALSGRSGSAVFVIARNQAGQIVAVRKEDSARLPLEFQISGADAMFEGTSFEGPMDLTARLSQTGDAIPAAGDVEGTAKGIAPGTRGVSIVLDSVRQ